VIQRTSTIYSTSFEVFAVLVLARTRSRVATSKSMQAWPFMLFMFLANKPTCAGHCASLLCAVCCVLSR
jgi:hypothetical protein